MLTTEVLKHTAKSARKLNTACIILQAVFSLSWFKLGWSNKLDCVKK